MEKAESRLNDFMGRSKVLVLASHSEPTIRKFCNKALLLEHGKLLGIGGVDEMFALYGERIATGGQS
jgi:ABC-2 type transport system ATP-binding protein/lipopolysaccharide transport system ATP-binding protein